MWRLSPNYRNRPRECLQMRRHCVGVGNQNPQEDGEYPNSGMVYHGKSYLNKNRWFRWTPILGNLHVLLHGDAACSTIQLLFKSAQDWDVQKMVTDWSIGFVNAVLLWTLTSPAMTRVAPRSIGPILRCQIWLGHPESMFNAFGILGEDRGSHVYKEGDPFENVLLYMFTSHLNQTMFT